MNEEYLIELIKRHALYIEQDLTLHSIGINDSSEIKFAFDKRGLRAFLDELSEKIVIDVPHVVIEQDFKQLNKNNQ